jgi:hypothetical protein
MQELSSIGLQFKSEYSLSINDQYLYTNAYSIPFKYFYFYRDLKMILMHHQLFNFNKVSLIYKRKLQFNKSNQAISAYLNKELHEEKELVLKIQYIQF